MKWFDKKKIVQHIDFEISVIVFCYWIFKFYRMSKIEKVFSTLLILSRQQNLKKYYSLL